GQVGDGADSPAAGHDSAVVERDWRQVEAEELQWGLGHGEDDVWDRADPGRAGEGEAVALAERGLGDGVAEAGQWTAQHGVERLEVVQAADVVGVKVGVE